LITDGNGSATKVGGISGGDRVDPEWARRSPFTVVNRRCRRLFSVCVNVFRHGGVEAKNCHDGSGHLRGAIAMLRMTLPPTGLVFSAVERQGA
jgi:hypothetical protein